MLFWIIVIGAGVFIGLLAFATLELWLPKLIVVVLIALQFGAAAWFGWSWKMIALFDGAMLGLCFLLPWLDDRERRNRQWRATHMTASEQAIKTRFNEVGIAVTDLQVDRDVAWVRLFHLSKNTHVTVRTEYRIDSTDQSVADELIRLVKEAGY